MDRRHHALRPAPSCLLTLSPLLLLVAPKPAFFKGRIFVFHSTKDSSLVCNAAPSDSDYNLFEPGKPLKNGTFIISEQIPGYVINNDLSQLVQEKGYFGSYNTAYDPYLRQISGADAAEAKAGPWLGYWTTGKHTSLLPPPPAVPRPHISTHGCV